ncbi:MAG: hypothetical protein Q9162_000279 [Coniocarpon cinnabarinum]
MGKHRYGVVLDAGSSGTRLHIYKWPNAEDARVGASADELRKLPAIKTKKEWTKKVHPGISTFGEKPEVVGGQHLRELLDHAQKVIPKDDIEVTPIFLLATAGVRLLPDRQRQELLSNVCTYTRKHTRFLLPDCNLQVQAISGETEGLYGWLATNYLLGGFNDPYSNENATKHHTYGFLDLGGASAQIAFAPNSTEVEKHSNDLHTVRLRSTDGGSQEYQVFVTTWLGYGVNEAKSRYTKELISHVDVQPEAEIPDPCLPKGMVKDLEHFADLPKHADRPPHFIGTGKFSECMARTFPLLDKDAVCKDDPCLFNGRHVPAIDFDINHFVGVSEYWHTTHDVFEKNQKDRAYDFKTYQQRVNEFCGQDWNTIEKEVSINKYGNNVDKQTAGEVCFKASWLLNLLHEGFGIPREGLETNQAYASALNTTKNTLNSAKQDGNLAPFQAVNKIDNTEVSWTLGKMILYASSMVPSSDDSSHDVGFGKNVPSHSTDAFEAAGGKPDVSIGGSSDHSYADRPGLESPSQGQNPDWRQQLMHHPKRTPGLLFILLIILIALILLCGRDRRNNFFRKIFPWRRPPGTPTSAGGLSRKLRLNRGESGGKYDRVMEEGDMAAAAGEFELGALSSSSSDAGSEGEGSARHSIASKSSGRKRATPGTATGSPRKGNYSPTASSIGLNSNRNSYFEGIGLGLSGMASNRASRERLAPAPLTLGDGRRSRGVSPNRVRSPLMTPYKEAID